MKKALDPLWGAILDAVSFDVASQTVTLDLRVPKGDQETTHTLVAHGVHELRFTNTIPGPWTYAELTEIHAEALANDGLMITAMIWSEESRLVIVADAITLNGVDLAASNTDKQEQ